MICALRAGLTGERVRLGALAVPTEAGAFAPCAASDRSFVTNFSLGGLPLSQSLTLSGTAATSFAKAAREIPSLALIAATSIEPVGPLPFFEGMGAFLGARAAFLGAAAFFGFGRESFPEAAWPAISRSFAAFFSVILVPRISQFATEFAWTPRSFPRAGCERPSFFRTERTSSSPPFPTFGPGFPRRGAVVFFAGGRAAFSALAFGFLVVAAFLGVAVLASGVAGFSAGLVSAAAFVSGMSLSSPLVGESLRERKGEVNEE